MRIGMGSTKSPRVGPSPKRAVPPSRADRRRPLPTAIPKSAENFRTTLSLLVACALFLGACGSGTPSSKAGCTLVVATYDSLAAAEGWGRILVSKFNEASPSCPARLVSGGDGIQILNRISLEKSRGSRSTHVVLGIDQFAWDRFLPDADAWGEWRPADWESLPESLRSKPGFLPLDWSPFALVVDGARIPAGASAPRTIRELASPRWKGKLLAQDPRTSTPGAGFLEATSKAAGGEDRVVEFWRRLRPSILTWMPGWDQAYGAFLQGEAPLVWSYLTSQAYHRMHGDRDGRYRAVVPADAEVLQVEGAALVRESLNSPALLDAAHRFLDLAISFDAQALVPEKQWMFPARSDVPLPQAFRELGFEPLKKRVLEFPTADSQRNRLERWERAVRGEGAP